MRVVVADDSMLIREGLARLLAEAGCEIVGKTTNAVHFDKPYEDKKTVRGDRPVHGGEPFSAPFMGLRRVGARRQPGHDQPERWRGRPGATFEQTILDNLAKAGIQNGKRNERIGFATLEPYADKYLQPSANGPPTTAIPALATPPPSRMLRPGSGSRSARSTARSARGSSRTRHGRRSGPTTWTCCAYLGSPSTHRPPASPKKTG